MEREGRTARRLAWTTGALLVLTAGLLLAGPVAEGRGVHGTTVVAKVSSHAKPKTTCTAGTNPEYSAYDPTTKWLYVANSYGGTISVYKGTCTLVKTISLPTGAQPRGVVYSPGTNRVYVADWNLSQVYVINKLTIKQTVTSPYLDHPFGLAYDPSFGYYYGGGSIWVTNQGNDTVAVLAAYPATGPTYVYTELATGSAPTGVCYSPVFNSMAIVNQYSDNVTTYDATYLTQQAAGIPVGSDPIACAYDPATLLTYVTNFYGTNVSGIDAYFDFASVPVGLDPFGLAYDPSTLQMDVANYGSHNVSEINDVGVDSGKVKLPTADEPIVPVWDPNNNKMYVTIWNTAQVDVL